MSTPRLRLGQLLVDAKMISQQGLDEVLAVQRGDGRRLGTLMVERGLINETQLTQILSHQLSVPWVSLLHIEFSRQLLNLVPRSVAERFCLVPIYVRHVRNQGETLYVAMDDPTNDEGLRECMAHSGLPVRAMIAPPEDIRSAIRVYYRATAPKPQPEELAPREQRARISTAPPPPAEPAASAAASAPEATPSPAAGPATVTTPAPAATLASAAEPATVTTSAPAADPARTTADAGAGAPATAAVAEESALPEARAEAAVEGVTKARVRAELATREEAALAAAEQADAARRPRAPEAPVAEAPARAAVALAPSAGFAARVDAALAAEPPPSQVPAPRADAGEGPLIEAVEIQLPLRRAAAAALAEAALAGAEEEPPPPSERAVDSIPQPRGRAPRMVSLTLLDGTTITLPARSRKRAPAEGPQRRSSRPPGPHEGTARSEPPDDEMAGLTARDLVTTLRAVSHGADASEVLGSNVRWEAMFAALLSLLLKKHLIADWEFVEELKKI